VITPVGAHVVPDPRVAFDWSLLRACAAPLLLTRKRPWKPVPRFGAAIDLGAGADEELGARLIRLAEQLTRRCSAHLEYLYAAPDAGEDSPAEQAWQRLTELAANTQESPGLSGWLHCLQGQPREVLPRLVGERSYDLLVMGCPPPQGGALAGFIDDDAPQPAALGHPSGHRPAVLENARRTPVGLLRAADGDLLVLPA
jgi:nucleotide-binding universal stress UspA family protein